MQDSYRSTAWLRILAVLSLILAGGLDRQAVADPQPQPKEAVQSDQPEQSPAENPRKRALFSRAVKEVRSAMADRDLPGARRKLKTVTANVQNDADQAQAERLQVMQENLEEFWKGIRGAVARLQPTEEIDLHDNRVAVIAASRDELMVQVYGQPQRYRVEAMPVKLLGAIVDRSFSPTGGSKVIVGTFLAVDREASNRAQARKLFQEAAKQGEPMGKQLLPELDVPIPESSPKRR